MNNQIKKILLVDDDKNIRRILDELLGDLGYLVTQADSSEKGLILIDENHYDLIISDIRMSGKTGIDLLKACQEKYPNIPIIIITAHADLDSAVTAYQEGAFEYLPKPFELDEVIAAVNRAFSIEQTSQPIKTQKKTSQFTIIGEAPSMQDLYKAIGRLSNSHMTVLIHGESGTGKELVANALHQNSPRKNSPFIALNMAAIPKDLIESELFGHEKGSFTGATSRYLGRFEQANQGTLFLDEIGDMPLDAQTRLLRVLSEGTFYRIGSSQPLQVDVRIIAATHQDLIKKIEQGAFREDLYHRLNVIPLFLPPLKERHEDIPLLVEFFFKQISQEINEPKKSLTNDALEILKKYSWPGNIRQLENICRWLSVMINSSNILASDLPLEIKNSQLNSTTNEQSRNQLNWQEGLSKTLLQNLKNGDKQCFINTQKTIEQLLIKTALNSTNNKKAEAAKLLGWGRNTLTRKQKDN